MGQRISSPSGTSMGPQPEFRDFCEDETLSIFQQTLALQSESGTTQTLKPLEPLGPQQGQATPMQYGPVAGPAGSDRRSSSESSSCGNLEVRILIGFRV